MEFFLFFFFFFFFVIIIIIVFETNTYCLESAQQSTTSQDQTRPDQRPDAFKAEFINLNERYDINIIASDFVANAACLNELLDFNTSIV